MRRRVRDAMSWQCVLLLSTPLVCGTPCRAAAPVGAVPEAHGPEFMLYVSLPIGPLAPARSFGLRIDQHSWAGPAHTAAPGITDLSGRREIVNLRMAEHQSLRLDLGRRVSWDFRTHRLALPSDPPALRLSAQSLASVPRLPAQRFFARPAGQVDSPATLPALP